MATPMPRTFDPWRLPARAFRSSHLNSSAPRSRACFTNALVTCARDAAVLAEAGSRPADHAGARPADVMLLLAADAHHHWNVGFLCQEGRNRHRHRAGPFAPESAAGVFADEDNLRRVDADPARQRV